MPVWKSWQAPPGTSYARKFIQADMGITGANFLVAETGTLVLVTNEGNGQDVHFDAQDPRRDHGHGEDRPVH